MELSSPIKYTGITWDLRVLTRILWFKVLCKCFIDFAPVMNMWQFMFHASCRKPPKIVISQEWNKHRSEKSTSSNSFELLVVELATPCMNYQGYKQNLIISKCLRTVWRHETASFIRTLFQTWKHPPCFHAPHPSFYTPAGLRGYKNTWLGHGTQRFVHMLVPILAIYT